jgi:hypothetical protein
VVEDWQRNFLLLSLQHVIDGSTLDSLKWILFDATMLFSYLTQETMATQLFTFGVNRWVCFKVL